MRESRPARWAVPDGVREQRHAATIGGPQVLAAAASTLPSSPTPPTRQAELWHGARDSLPILVGAAPFGLIFGTLAAPSGLSAGGALAMSLLVFAGSSQFIALTLLANGTGLAVLLLTTFIVNLRHALYSATLLPYVAHLPQ